MAGTFDLAPLVVVSPACPRHEGGVLLGYGLTVGAVQLDQLRIEFDVHRAPPTTRSPSRSRSAAAGSANSAVRSPSDAPANAAVKAATGMQRLRPCPTSATPNASAVSLHQRHEQPVAASAFFGPIKTGATTLRFAGAGDTRARAARVPA